MKNNVTQGFSLEEAKMEIPKICGSFIEFDMLFFLKSYLDEISDTRVLEKTMQFDLRRSKSRKLPARGARSWNERFCD